MLEDRRKPARGVPWGPAAGSELGDVVVGGRHGATVRMCIISIKRFAPPASARPGPAALAVRRTKLSNLRQGVDGTKSRAKTEGANLSVSGAQTNFKEGTLCFSLFPKKIQ